MFFSALRTSHENVHSASVFGTCLFFAGSYRAEGATAEWRQAVPPPTTPMEVAIVTVHQNLPQCLALSEARGKKNKNAMTWLQPCGRRGGYVTGQSWSVLLRRTFIRTQYDCHDYVQGYSTSRNPFKHFKVLNMSRSHIWRHLPPTELKLWLLSSLTQPNDIWGCGLKADLMPSLSHCDSSIVEQEAAQRCRRHDDGRPELPDETSDGTPWRKWNEGGRVRDYGRSLPNCVVPDRILRKICSTRAE